MRDDKKNSPYLLHIHDAIEKIIPYTTSHSFQQFEENQWDQAAVLRYLEVIGEAASKLDLSFRQANPQIPWREIIDLRNVVVYHYMDVDIALIWKIVAGDSPKLKEQIDKIV